MSAMAQRTQVGHLGMSENLHSNGHQSGAGAPKPLPARMLAAGAKALASQMKVDPVEATRIASLVFAAMIASAVKSDEVTERGVTSLIRSGEFSVDGADRYPNPLLVSRLLSEMFPPNPGSSRHQ